MFEWKYGVRREGDNKDIKEWRVVNKDEMFKKLKDLKYLASTGTLIHLKKKVEAWVEDAVSPTHIFKKWRDFPGGPVAKICILNAGGPGSI